MKARPHNHLGRSGGKKTVSVVIITWEGDLCGKSKQISHLPDFWLAPAL